MSRTIVVQRFGTFVGKRYERLVLRGPGLAKPPTTVPSPAPAPAGERLADGSALDVAAPAGSQDHAATWKLMLHYWIVQSLNCKYVG